MNNIIDNLEAVPVMRRDYVQNAHARRSQWRELFLQVRSVRQTILSAPFLQWPRLELFGGIVPER
jgi:hypothetical protein